MAAGSAKPKKMFYTMGEVAEMFDVNPSLLRFWERKFDIIKPKKSGKGNRMFTPEDIRNIKLIYHLVKERGMTLEGAGKYIKAGRGDIERDMELAERLQSIRSLLLEVRQKLGVESGPAVIIPDDTGESDDSRPVEPTVEQAHKEEAIDVLMEEATGNPHTEPEDMPGFGLEPQAGDGRGAGPDTGAGPEPEAEKGTERETGTGPGAEVMAEEPAKPVYIEQTLF